MRYAIVLLCRDFAPYIFELLLRHCAAPLYDSYDFYICVDRNIPLSQHDRIKIIQIDDALCYANGFHHMTYSIQKTPVSWDKAFYYFTRDERIESYDYIWFIEDDVFIPSIETIHNIDARYDQHLLSQSCAMSLSYDTPGWQWHVARGHIGLPLFSSLMCACRISRDLMKVIRNYAETHKRLFFLEIMIPTLCCQSRLRNKVIPELKMIQYRYDWNTHFQNGFDKMALYHPIKDHAIQKKWFMAANR